MVVILVVIILIVSIAAMAGGNRRKANNKNNSNEWKPMEYTTKAPKETATSKDSSTAAHSSQTSVAESTSSREETTAYRTAVLKITYAIQRPPEKFRLPRQPPESVSYLIPKVPARPAPADPVPIL